MALQYSASVGRVHYPLGKALARFSTHRGVELREFYSFYLRIGL